MDRSDLPGAAGSWSLYKGHMREPKDDIAAQLYAYLPHEHFITSASYISILCCCLGVLGTQLFTHALVNRRSGLYAGFLIAFWPPLHMLGGLYGNDPVAIGLAMMGLGLLSFACKYPKAFPLGLLGATLLPIAVASKTLALPLFILLPILLKLKPRLLLLGMYGYCLYWGYAWYWPTQSALPSAEHSLTQGLESLYNLSRYQLNEGKYLQLVFAACVATLCCTTPRRALPLLLLTLIGLGFTLTLLVEKTRPRYLIVFGLPLFSLIAQGLSTLRLRRPLLLLMICALFLDTWAHQYAFDLARHRNMLTTQSSLPPPPQIWLNQYTPFPSRILRDLSLIAAQPLTKDFKAGSHIATPPLRDARERSLMAYARIYGGNYLVLDPQKCCHTPSLKCVASLEIQLDKAGFDVFLPHHNKHEPRMDLRLDFWRKLLMQHYSQKLHSHNAWLYLRSSNSGGHIPCQRPVDITPQ